MFSMYRSFALILGSIGAAIPLLAGCGSAGTEQASDFSSANNMQSLDPEIANTAAASLREPRTDAGGEPRIRTESSVKGPGATDTSGRAAQEREETH
jgi:hypothetical protein